MKIRAAEFEIGAVRRTQWPRDGLPEFAFIGRSNVGKSSLLNRLVARKSLARVSNVPGKTREINFYRINDTLRFADLPGYGYARVSQRDRARFAKMLEEYLCQRRELVRVFHLIDIRHPPTELDVTLHRRLLKLEVPTCVVATKLDKISKAAVKPALDGIRTTLATWHPLVAVSSEKNVGVDALWECIAGDLEALRERSDTTLAHVQLSQQHAREDEHTAD